MIGAMTDGQYATVLVAVIGLWAWAVLALARACWRRVIGWHAGRRQVRVYDWWETCPALREPIHVHVRGRD